METLRDMLLTHPAVESVSAAVAVPGMNGWRGQLSFPEGWGEDESVSLEYIGVDAFYLRTMGLELVAGRDFDPERTTDAERAVIINEAAVREVGWASAADAIGKQFTSPGSGKPDGVVIGVVRDYNHHGLQEEIGSIMYGLTPVGGLVAVRFARGQSASVQEHVHSVVEAFHPTYTTRSWMLGEGFARQYEQEVRLGQVTGVFSILAVVIALLGLFGLAAYEAVQRTREIGIRKVLGASSSRIMRLLVARTMALVLAGYAVAVPIVLVAIGRWQASFAYAAPVFVPYVVGGGLGLGVLCLVAVGYQAFRAGRRRPVHALRME